MGDVNDQEFAAIILKTNMRSNKIRIEHEKKIERLKDILQMDAVATARKNGAIQMRWADIKCSFSS
jgi:hypothetical protein